MLAKFLFLLFAACGLRFSTLRIIAHIRFFVSGESPSALYCPRAVDAAAAVVDDATADDADPSVEDTPADGRRRPPGSRSPTPQ